MKQKFDSIPQEFEADVMTAEEYCTPRVAFLDASEYERRQEHFRLMQDIAAVLALALFGLAFMLMAWAITVDRKENLSPADKGGAHSGVSLIG